LPNKQDTCATSEAFEIYERNLPHWRQSGATYYVTFRLADSMPQEKLRELTLEQGEWRKRHPEPRSPSVVAEYHRLFSEKVEQWLDAGAGSCVLREPDAAKIVADTLKHFDGQRYRLGEWVVMPNHVHLLVTPLPQHELSDILHSWKSFTANKINERFHRTGTLWQHESYDHIVRDDDELHRIEQYIRDNPAKACIDVTQASSLYQHKVAQASSLQDHKQDACATFKIVAQASSLPSRATDSLDNHKQDACATNIAQASSLQGHTQDVCAAPLVPRQEIETFIHLGDQAAHYEAARMSGTKSYKPELPGSIATHARLIDEKLADITVCDPAVGSGAFPVGMMTEIVRARSALTPYFDKVEQASSLSSSGNHKQNACATLESERTPYHFKRHAIQNCLYGVDIDASAVEIAKLRLWLSLVVDEEDVQQIKPLPNLDYKIVAGNSLIGFPFKSLGRSEIEVLKQQFFDETDHEKKTRLKSRIDQQLAKTFAASKQSLGYEVNFDFEIYFSEVLHRKGGFDLLIANPPYVRQEKIKELKPALKAFGYECFNGTADLLVYFYERGVKLLRPGGAIALITSNKFYRAGYGEALRAFLPRELTLHRLIDFGDAPVFEAIAYASILTGTRISPPKDSAALGYTWEQEMSFDRITQIVADRGQEILQSELKPDGWRLASPAVLRLLEKLRAAGTPLGEYVNGRLYRGILTGLNEAFVVDRATRDWLIAEHPSSSDVLKPFLRGRDVKRWRIEPQDLWLIFTRRGIDIKKYPAIYEHLIQFKLLLSKRAGDQRWYELQASPGDVERFEQPKIVIPAISQTVNYAPDWSGHYSNDKTSICVTDSVSYLLGILNSSLMWWFIQQTAATKQGGFYEFKPMYVSQIPIPPVSVSNQSAIERIVDRILAAKQRDAEADVSAWEREIDQIVYDLYGLTPEEIKIVPQASSLPQHKQDAWCYGSRL
jgi:REP element-mobilizing transposase RayT